MHVLVHMTERQFRSVVCTLKTGEDQLRYNVFFWYMDYYAMSSKNALTNYQVSCLPFTRSDHSSGAIFRVLTQQTIV